MPTLRPRPPGVEAPSAPTAERPSRERRALLACHVRPGGVDEPHTCSICLSSMHAFQDVTPNWLQSTCCREVWHEACLRRYVEHNLDDALAFLCPWCKAPHAEHVLDAWDPDDAYEALWPDESYEEEEEESDTDEDDKENAESPPKRHCTRSTGRPASPPLKRRLRSSAELA